MKIFSDPATYYLTQSESIVGEFFLGDAGAHFPEAGWYDFPIFIFLQLTKAILGSGTMGRNSEYIVRFMDGPCYLLIEPDPRISQLKISGVWDGRLKRIEIQCSIEKKEFTAVVIGAAQCALRQCELNDWSGDDVVSLRELLKMSS